MQCGLTLGIMKELLWRTVALSVSSCKSGRRALQLASVNTSWQQRRVWDFGFLGSTPSSGMEYTSLTAYLPAPVSSVSPSLTTLSPRLDSCSFCGHHDSYTLFLHYGECYLCHAFHKAWMEDTRHWKQYILTSFLAFMQLCPTEQQ